MISSCQILSEATESVLPEQSAEENLLFDSTAAPTIDNTVTDSQIIPSLENIAVSEVEEAVEQAIEPEFKDLWARTRAGFRLSHETDRKRVLNELKWFVNHPEYVERVTKRAEPHLYHIVTELERRGLPLEFALLPIVESAYDPFAYSHGRAAGLWQFIPSTARVYGLKIDWWYDGRRDVRASTKAAIDYLEYLNDMFKGDWLLALAAYNAGQGNVLSSIRASKLPRAEADFWSLKVLRETYTYVPRLLAISEIIANPESYHMELPAIANKPYWQVVSIDTQLDLNKAAELAGITPKKLYSLNPGFNQWATHPDGPHELLVPLDAAKKFEAGLATLKPEQRVAWQRHKVRSGESLGTIARKYRTTIDTIRSANEITGNLIRQGDSLLIPVASAGVSYAMTESGRLANRQASLKNSLGAEPITYTVKPGDSLWEISRKQGVGMRELARWNGMGTTGLLHPGTKLKIFKAKMTLAPANVSASINAVKKAREQVRKVNYRVRAGESLSLIASKFNVSVQSIKTWNETLNVRKYIHPGDRLTLYIDVTSLIN